MDVRSISANGVGKLDVAPVQAAILSGNSQQHTQDSYPTATALLHKEKYDLTISDQAMRKAIEKANKAMEGIDRRFEYSVHEKTGETIVKVINKDNNEVIREIPNEKFLDLMAKLQELVGLNIDEKR
ncbi:flagellar protein FlaG [Cohnella candidum]|nr:flagellar protein FlaG [Cohnella candidum]